MASSMLSGAESLKRVGGRAPARFGSMGSNSQKTRVFVPRCSISARPGLSLGSFNTSKKLFGSIGFYL
ncbi:hypothetical protein SLA2020_501680 [Shorea laevis]